MSKLLKYNRFYFYFHLQLFIICTVKIYYSNLQILYLPSVNFTLIFFSPGYEKIVENEGMPILEKYPEKGNLVIRFNIDFPNYLPKNSKELLKKGFQMAKVGGGVNQHEIINKLVLADKILRVDPDERLPPI